MTEDRVKSTEKAEDSIYKMNIQVIDDPQACFCAIFVISTEKVLHIFLFCLRR